MFGKDKKEKMSNLPTNLLDPAGKNISDAKTTPLNQTIIAGGVRLEGNLFGSSEIYIYGEVTGTVDAGDGLVKIMRHGVVKGDIRCKELIINGDVQGECYASSICLDEYANANGLLSYATLSVQPGGVFVGKAEKIILSESKTKVIDIVNKKVAESGL